MVKDFLDFSKFLIDHYKISIGSVFASILIISLFVTKPSRHDQFYYIFNNGELSESRKEDIRKKIEYSDGILFTTLSYKCDENYRNPLSTQHGNKENIITFGDKVYGTDRKTATLIRICSSNYGGRYLTIGFFGKIHEASNFNDALEMFNY